jgi:signal transduction histidine kinase/CheY-like chemotaxis protein
MARKLPLKLCLLLISLFLCTGAYSADPTPQTESERQAVTIVYNVGNPPLKFLDDQGQAAGILMDLWRLWSEKSGVAVDFQALPWDETLASIKEGHADIHAGLFYTKERDGFLDYSSYPLLELDYHFFYHNSIKGIDRLEDLIGLQIGVPKGYTEKFMRERLPTAVLTVYDNFPSIYAAAERGEIKAFISPNLNYRYHLKQGGKSATFEHHPEQPVYTRTYLGAVREGGQELLKLLDEGLVRITPEERVAIEERWLSVTQTDTADIITILNPRNMAPFSMFNDAGEAVGIIQELWQRWGELSGRKISIRLGGEKQILPRVASGLADIGGGVFLDGEAAEGMLLSVPLINIPVHLYSRAGTAPSLTLQDLTGKGIGFHQERVSEHLASIAPGALLKEYRNTKEMVRALDQGEIEAFLSDPVSADYTFLQTGRAGQYIRSHSPVLKAGFHAAVRKGDEALLEQINGLFRSLGPEEVNIIIGQWLGKRWRGEKPKALIPLTREEQAWLDGHRSQILGIDPVWPPVEYFAADRVTYLGMASDVMSLISERLGVDFTPATGLSWSQVHEHARKGEIDILPAVSKAPSRTGYLNFTRPYLTFPQVIFTRNDAPFFISDLTDLYDKRIVVEQGYSTEERLLDNYADFELVRVENTIEALKHLSEGKVDAYVGNLTIGSYLLLEHGLNNIKVAAPTPFAHQLSIGVRKDWPEMLSIVQKALDGIQPEEMSSIRQKWMSVRYQKEIDYKRLWQVAGGAAAAILLILTWTAWISRQRHMVSEARDQAEQASRFKSEFLANMSHEIRTPMNAIVGLCHLTARTELTPKQHDYIDKIQYSAQSLLSVINDILDFSKIEAGKLKIEYVEFSMENVLNNLATLTSVKVGEKGLEIVFDATPDVPDRLIGDPFRLGQVLLNLVHNAIKFTEKGEILVRISRLVEETGEGEDESRRIWLQFEVRDTGIGISEEQLQGLFSPFIQADGSTTRKYGGTGLGLSISRQLVSLMGGDIDVTSKPGEGSCFFFRLPFDIAEQPLQHRIVPDVRGMRVLLVDDNQTSLEVLTNILTSLSFDVTAMQSGEEALEHLENTDQPYDLVLLDWVMPGMDGEETAEQIRQRTSETSPLIVIMITAYGREFIESRIDNSLIDDLLIKPVTSSQLFDAIMRAKADQPGAAGAVAGHTRNRVSSGLPRLKGNVLLAEDNDINQQVARELLEHMGLAVSIANNGVEAVEAVRRHNYDLVLMDIQMPEMDGYEATGIIRKNKKLKNLPIIAITANAMSSDRDNALNAGMNEHIAKPIDPESLYHILSHWLPEDGSAMAAGQEDLASEIPDDLQKTLKGINIAAGIARVGGNHELYRKLAIQFYQDHGNILYKLIDLIGKSDQKTAHRLVHTIKGVAGNIGAEALQQAALKQEQHLKQSSSPRIIDPFRKACIEIFSGLKKLAEAHNQNADIETANSVDIDLPALLGNLRGCLEEGDGNSLNLLKTIGSTLESDADRKVYSKLQQQVSTYDFDDALVTLNDWIEKRPTA